jgi:hypothetical protein
MEYWVPDVTVAGVSELVANALVMEGENDRSLNLRGEPIPGRGGEEQEDV